MEKMLKQRRGRGMMVGWTCQRSKQPFQESYARRRPLKQGQDLVGKKMHNYTDLSRNWRDNFLVPLREVVEKEKRKTS